MGSRRVRGPMVKDNVTILTSGSSYAMKNEAALVVNKSSGSATAVTLPVTFTGVYRFVDIKDGKGDAASNNITITPVSGTIDGGANYVISTAYGGVTLFYNGTEWNAISMSPIVATTAGVATSAIDITKSLTGMADNTNVKLATITVTNILCGGSVTVAACGTLGDGDASDYAVYNIAISRIAGANALSGISSKIGDAATTGATANAAITVSVGAVAGAVGATNTFDVNIKVARSAGTSSNHTVIARLTTLNMYANGIATS